MSRVFRQIVCAGLAAVSLPLLASDSGIQTGLIPLSTPNLPTVTAPDEVVQPQPLPDIPGLEIEVFGFVYDGVTLFDPIEFDQLNLDELLGTATIQDLRNAADRIAAFYRERGYLASVFLPRQDVTQGIVNFQIVESRIGQIQDPTDAAVSRERLAEALLQGEILEFEALDRALLLADDLAGVNVTGRLVEGGEVGQTDILVIETDEPDRLTANLNNSGSRSTGRIRGELNWQGVAPGTQSTQMNLGAVKSEGVDQVSASLAWPVGIDGLTAGVQISRLNYEVVEGDQVALDPEGTSQSSAITLRYPLIRARNQNLYLSAEISRADYRNEASGAVTSDYQVQTSQLGLSGNQFLQRNGLPGSVQGGVTLTEGVSDRAGSDDHFWILGTNLSYTQQVEATDRISLRWRTQRTDQTLDSSQRISLGGPSGVRAYPAGEGSGDDVHIVSAEFQRDLNEKTQVGIFYDWGYTRARDDEDYELDGIGLSLSRSLTPSLSLSAQVARRLGNHPKPSASGNNQDGSSDKTQYWLRLNYER